MRILVLTDRFPELSETFVVAEVRALAELGHEVRIEALSRSERPSPAAAGLSATYLAEDGRRRKLLDGAWLAARHPLRAARDLLERRRWRAEERVRPLRSLAPAARRLARGGEQHIHVHFAGEAALDGLRLARIAAVPYSVTAHAYEIFMSPANLREKLESAAFATTGCLYNLDRLTLIAPSADLHEIVMGVDGDRFVRSTPYGRGRRVLAVGRLIEKKGFGHLIEAAARLRDVGKPLERLTIVGAGPLDEQLQQLAVDRDITHSVKLVGPKAPDEVRDMLEEADLLAMPCVVAADGDRDSMPVVVKEALAMEVPVVASDEVGLPELVHPDWGALVPPGDPARLAGAIAKLLDLPRDRRAEMGRAGRTHVLAMADVRVETAKLAGLIVRASDGA